MNNYVVVKVTFADVKRVNNKEIPVFCYGELKVNIDRRFLYNLEDTVDSFRELGTVEIEYSKEPIATLKKDCYRIAEKEVSFQRFGGKIAKEFYCDIDKAIEQIENSEQYIDEQ